MNNPILQRELIGMLRTRKALAMQVGPAVLFALLVAVRWPTDARVDLSGAQAQSVFRLFAYGLLTTLLVLVPVFPATAIVREKNQGTLALLLNSPMSRGSIYLGKLLSGLGFVLLPLMMSLPAAAACYTMGGLSFAGDVLLLYGVLAVLSLQLVTLSLLVSCYANTTDSALRIAYALVLAISVLVLGPYQFLQGKPWGLLVTLSYWLRALSPIPPVMEIIGQSDVGSQGLMTAAGGVGRYVTMALAFSAYAMIHAVTRLSQTMLDRSRPQGVITDERSKGQQWLRRLMFLVDPQRRKGLIGPLVNPVMVKEFRSRRFGRSHWMMRLVAVCALASLLLTYTTTTGTTDWGVETIGGIMVLLQVALIVLLTPSLAAGLISTERESGGWTLLQMTPLSAGTIIRGKLMSVVWTLFLILFATLPGYAVMILIKPVLARQVVSVLVCLLLTATFALMLSATVSSLFRRTAPATMTVYALLVILFGGSMLFWLGRDAPFGHDMVEAILTLNPMAAALSIMDVSGFKQYELVPANWWFMLSATLACLVVLTVQIRRMGRPM